MSEQVKIGEPQEGTKWYKTRKCGCGDCRFFSEEERPSCPMENEPGAIWLYAMNLDFFQRKDYVDPLDGMVMTHSGIEQQQESSSE